MVKKDDVQFVIIIHRVGEVISADDVGCKAAVKALPGQLDEEGGGDKEGQTDFAH